jgi:hypothetical protein
MNSIIRRKNMPGTLINKTASEIFITAYRIFTETKSGKNDSLGATAIAMLLELAELKKNESTFAKIINSTLMHGLYAGTISLGHLINKNFKLGLQSNTVRFLVGALSAALILYQDSAQKRLTHTNDIICH